MWHYICLQPGGQGSGLCRVYGSLGCHLQDAPITVARATPNHLAQGALGQALSQEAPPHPFATSVLLREPGSPSADLSEPQAHLTVMATWTSP